MDPYAFVIEETQHGESLLSLCCGVGIELRNVKASKITAVDIYPGYLAEVKTNQPRAKTVESDAYTYIKQQSANSVDVITLIDAIEHLDKETGIKLLKRCKRVAKKSILVFTPEGYVRNETHDAWGVSGGDNYQKHLSGWEVDELRELGFTLLHRWSGKTHHGDDYNAIMLRCSV